MRLMLLIAAATAGLALFVGAYALCLPAGLLLCWFSSALDG